MQKILLKIRSITIKGFPVKTKVCNSETASVKYMEIIHTVPSTVLDLKPHSKRSTLSFENTQKL